MTRFTFVLLTLLGMACPLPGAPIIIDDFSVGPIEVIADPAGGTNMTIYQTDLTPGPVWNGNRWLEAGTYGSFPPGLSLDASMVVDTADRTFTYRANSSPEGMSMHYGLFSGAPDDGFTPADFSQEGGQIILGIRSQVGFDDASLILSLRNDKGEVTSQSAQLGSLTGGSLLLFQLADNEPTIDLSRVDLIQFVVSHRPPPGELSIQRIMFVPEPRTLTLMVLSLLILGYSPRRLRPCR